MTLNELSRLIRRQAIRQPDLEALNLLELVSRMSQAKILAGDFKLNKSQIKKLKQLAKKRRKLPLAYIKKEKEFYNLNFYVDKNVLIPRPESEDIINLALSFKTKPTQIYDIGCGCGCLGISYLKTLKSDLKIDFLDISQKALKITQKNCRRHQIKGANFKRINVSEIEKPFFMPGSLILANLPYLDIRRRHSYEKRCPELKSEPRVALYALKNGLELYGRLFTNCRNQDLNIICESLKDQRAGLISLARNNGYALKAQEGLATAFVPLKRNGMDA